MNFNEYLPQAMRTNFNMGNITANQRHYMLGLFNEFGELAGLFKKELFGKEVKDKVEDELGDVYWYLAKGFYVTGMAIPDNYGYAQTDDTLHLTVKFTEAWLAEDLIKIFYVLDNVCDIYGIAKEDVFRKNIEKLAVRHPEKFDIDNKKHGEEEQAIFRKED